MQKKWYRLFILGVIILIIVFIYLNVFSGGNKLPADKTEVLVYFSGDNAIHLVAEKRMVETDRLYINTINELIKGPESSSLGKTIPDGTEILDIKIEDKLAVVNFNQKLRDNHWGGSTGELMTVYSIVNTLAQFSEIEEVRFLLNGDEIETLVGHMDLSQPLPPDEKLVK